LVLSFSNEHSRGGHFRDYITSVPLLTFPFSMSSCISIWRWTANTLCSARVGSNPILVVKGPQGLVLSFSNEHTSPFEGLHHQCPAPYLPYLPFLHEWLYFHLAL